MEKLIIKNRILIIAVVVLVIINAATIGTIIWQVKKFQRFERPSYALKRMPDEKQMQALVRKDLDFTDKQFNQFLLIDSIFRQQSKLLFDKMKAVRIEMVKELLKENPDSMKLNQLAIDLGKLHVELKKNTFEFIKSLRTICTAEQQEKLNNFIRRMIEFEGVGFRKPRDKQFDGEKKFDRKPFKDEPKQEAMPE